MDREQVKDIAQVIIKEYHCHFAEVTLPEAFKQFKELHVATCPHGKKVEKSTIRRNIWIGVGVTIWSLILTSPVWGKPLLKLFQP